METTKTVRCNIDGLMHALQTIKNDCGNLPVFVQFKTELLWLQNFRVEEANKEKKAVIITADYNPSLTNMKAASNETH